MLQQKPATTGETVAVTLPTCDTKNKKITAKMGQVSPHMEAETLVNVCMVCCKRWTLVGVN